MRRKVGRMADFSRREFLRKGSIGVAAGVAALGLGTEGGIARAATRATKTNDPPAEHGEAITSEPIVAYVRRGASGEVTVMAGSREVVHMDPDLARRIIRASKH